MVLKPRPKGNRKRVGIEKENHLCHTEVACGEPATRELVARSKGALKVSFYEGISVKCESP